MTSSEISSSLAFESLNRSWNFCFWLPGAFHSCLLITIISGGPDRQATEATSQGGSERLLPAADIDTHTVMPMTAATAFSTDAAATAQGQPWCGTGFLSSLLRGAKPLHKAVCYHRLRSTRAWLLVTEAGSTNGHQLKSQRT